MRMALSAERLAGTGLPAFAATPLLGAPPPPPPPPAPPPPAWGGEERRAWKAPKASSSTAGRLCALEEGVMEEVEEEGVSEPA